MNMTELDYKLPFVAKLFPSITIIGTNVISQYGMWVTFHQGVATPIYTVIAPTTADKILTVLIFQFDC